MRRAIVIATAALLVAAPAAAAHAAPADGPATKVGVSSGTVAIGAGQKEIKVTVTNLRDEPLTDPVLVVDRRSWDADQVALTFDDEACETVGDTVECKLGAELTPGRTADLLAGLEVAASASPGPAGKLVLHTRHAGGPEETFEFPLSVSGDSGPDLAIRAKDVPSSGGIVKPEQWTHVDYVVANHGDVAAANIHVMLELPAGAKVNTFLFAEDPVNYLYCFTEGDDRKATCEFPYLVLQPGKQFPGKFPIVIDKGAELGVNLTGAVSVVAEPATEEQVTAAKKAAEAGAVQFEDVDDADNRDEFQILLAPKQPGTPGGGTGGGDGGDSDEEPGLPVTGPSAWLGAVFLVVGAGLVLAGRQRRGEGVR